MSKPTFIPPRDQASLPVVLIVQQTVSNHYWCSCSHPLIEKYARDHNYALHWTQDSDMEYVDSRSRQHHDDTIESKFSKYSKALEYFDSSSLVVIMDCDIFITNPDITIESIWARHSTPITDMMLARDAHYHLGVPVNSGLIIVRPSTFAKNFFSGMLKSGRLDAKVHGNLYNAKTLVDQPRLTYDLIRLGQLEPVPMDANERHSHVSIVSQRVMNAFYRVPESYWSGAHKDPEESKWREGDWVAHVTGMSATNRVAAAKMFGNGCVGVKDESEGIVVSTDGVHGVV
jgi:hypothetical protein